MNIDIDVTVDAFDLLDFGVAVFGDNRRMIYCNTKFRDLRNLPGDVCRPGIAFDALMRFSAVRGDFGPGDIEAHVADRTAEFWGKDEGHFERTLSDGQILRIGHRRTPSGGLMISFDDRTEERRAQAALALSEERHALVTRSSSDGIYDWDVARDRIYISDNLRELLHVDLGFTGSRVWVGHVHPDDRARYSAAMRAHFKGVTEALECEYRVRARGGDYRWVLDRAIGVRDAGGRVVRVVGAVRDVSDIKAAETRLHYVESRLAASLGASSDGMLLVDVEGNVELCNERYAEIVAKGANGWDPMPAIVRGRPFFEMIGEFYDRGVFKPHPGGRDGWVTARRAAWQKPTAQWEVELSDGTWILLNERRMPDGGRVSCYTDITEMKRRESEDAMLRRRLEAAAEREARERRNLVTRMRKDASHLEWLMQLAKFLRHEVRQPVAQINTSLDLVALEATESEAVARHIGSARVGVQQIWNLIERASLATDAEAFVRRTNPEPHDLTHLVGEVIEGYRQSVSGVAFALNAETSPQCIVDAVQIKEALGNLLNNAVSYAEEESEITVGVAASRIGARVEVVNRGPLLARDPADLFRPFSSSRSGRSSEHHGLGLYLVRLIAENHGGSARIANLADRTGVRAEFHLPL